MIIKQFISILGLVPGVVLSVALASEALAAGSIQPFESDSVERIIQAQHGKAFLLIVWSLDCQYCQASLKAVSQEKDRRKTFSVVTISTDALDDPEAVTLMNQRLSSLRMTSNAWAFGAASPEQLRYAIDPKWHGEMPRSYWFNARGERSAYSGVITKKLIAEKLAAN